MRSSGIILPIFSLPSDYGIGTLGKEAYKFVDFLVTARQSYWQILPIGPTSFGDSPYQSFSSYAGNPYFIDLDILVKEGILDKEELDTINFGSNPIDIDYATLYEERYKVLKKAYKASKERFANSILEFEEKNKHWLTDYALFMALKDYNNGASWDNWEKSIKLRQPETLVAYSEKLKEDIEFYIYLQFMFYRQFNELKDYANQKGIKIIGDIPIYVAFDSADVWANPKYFLLNEALQPLQVAGCPPDAFALTGQLWGNPIYDWKALEEDGFQWWIDRVAATLTLFDVIRIDHFRGFESYWSVPFGDETAEHGQWIKGPGIKIFDAIKAALGDINIIAEDLGFITDDVRNLLKATDYPGMKVMQFGFNPSEESEYLPHNYPTNCVAYSGTHDNDTIKGWFKTLPQKEQDYCKSYTGMKDEDDNWSFINCLFKSVADTTIVQMQDLLNLGSEARTNIPSTIGINWRWRMNKKDVNNQLAIKLANICKETKRDK